MGGGSFPTLSKEIMDYIYDQFGIKRNIKHVMAVERLEKLKGSNPNNPWVVIEECLDMWKATNPTDYKSYLYHLDETRQTRADHKFGQSKTGMYRYTLDIPQKVLFMIRCLYDDTELPMNKEFFHEFARRFPKLKIAEKN
jgi:hypothetical protein